MDLGSGIRKKPIQDPGVKKAPDPGSGSTTLISFELHHQTFRNPTKDLFKTEINEEI
jgi:hypothetical protein